jgi:hypothetical protein
VDEEENGDHGRDQASLNHKPGKEVRSAWCEGCSGQATMISAEQAAVLAGVRSRTLHRWAHARAIHFTESPEGRLLICLRSLMMCGGETNKVDK